MPNNKSFLIKNFFSVYSSDSGTAFDDQSSSLIKLNNSTVLYLREVNKFLALVCILREYSFSRQGVIDFNFLCFREAIHKIFEIKKFSNEIYEDEDEEDEDEDDHLDCTENNDGDLDNLGVSNDHDPNDDFDVQNGRQYIR